MFEDLPKQRRTVLKGLLTAGAAVFTAPIAYAASQFLSYKGSPMTGSSVKLSADDLTPNAPWKLLDISGDPVIVLKTPDNSVRAFTATCPHMGCTVSYRPDRQDFFCKCHKGLFDKNGVNVPGTKPQEPLVELKVDQQAADLEVYLTPLKSA